MCAPCVIAGGCCCCCGARTDERARPDAAARCSTSACTTRNNLSHWEQPPGSLVHGFRWAVVAPRWLRWLHRALWPPQAIRSRVVCVGRGPGAQDRCPQSMGCLGRVVQASVVCYSGAIALVRKTRDSAECTAATTPYSSPYILGTFVGSSALTHGNPACVCLSVNQLSRGSDRRCHVRFSYAFFLHHKDLRTKEPPAES